MAVDYVGRAQERIQLANEAINSGNYDAAANYLNAASTPAGRAGNAAVNDAFGSAQQRLLDAQYPQPSGGGGGGGGGGGDTGGGGVTGGGRGPVVVPPPAFSALEIMNNFFKAAMGLEGMGAWAADLYNRGAMPDEIVRALRYGTDTSEAGKAARASYLAAFPGMDTILKDGIFPGENPEMQYLSYRNTVTEAANRYGVPSGLVAKEKIAEMILGRNSAVEITDRMNTAATAIATTPQDTYAVLERYYGIQSRDLMAFYLDTGPTEAELKKRYTAARIGTEAVRNQFGIEKGLAEDLAVRGVSIDEAQAGFGKAALQSGFMAGRGDVVTQDSLVNAQFGVAASAADVARVAAARKGRFDQGGDFEATAKGVAGLASAAI